MPDAELVIMQKCRYRDALVILLGVVFIASMMPVGAEIALSNTSPELSNSSQSHSTDAVLIAEEPIANVIIHKPTPAAAKTKKVCQTSWLHR
jgi:hypothetical protein